MVSELALGVFKVLDNRNFQLDAGPDDPLSPRAVGTVYNPGGQSNKWFRNVKRMIPWG